VEVRYKQASELALVVAFDEPNASCARNDAQLVKTTVVALTSTTRLVAPMQKRLGTPARAWLRWTRSSIPSMRSSPESSRSMLNWPIQNHLALPQCRQLLTPAEALVLFLDVPQHRCRR
jgi:hypothetical protein